MSKILVIVPTYNEEATIGKLVKQLLNLNLNLDILVVDDGTDKTPDIIKNHSAYGHQLFLIKRQLKSGRGTAVIEGLKFGLEGDYDYFVEMDADSSHQPDELPGLIKLAAADNVVIASRYLPGSQIKNWPLRRKIFSRLANFYANLVLGIGLHDYTNGYRVYGRAAVQKLDLNKIKSIGYIVLSEIAYFLHRRGVKFKENKTLFINRNRGVSNFSSKEIKEAFSAVWRIKKQFE